jgi:tripartite-type tricarboxylate transporter receptor subunit TctC
MSIRFSRAHCVAAFAAAAMLLATGASAQSPAPSATAGWPNQPIKVMVGFPAGGASDVMARLVAQKLGERLGVPVVIDNRPGAAGTLAAALTVQAPADGYTLLLGSPTAVTLAPSTLAGRIQYDPEKDLLPISKVAHYPLFLVASNEFGVKSAAEFVAKAKANPGKINFGSFGVVTSGGLAVEEVKLKAGVDVLHVPYNGSARALQALFGGEIDIMFDTAITALPNMRSGKLVGLGVASLERSPLAPDMPPVAEAIPGFEADSWNGLMARTGTPQPIVDRLQKEIAQLVRDPDIIKRFAALGAVPIGNSQAEFAQFLREETDRYTKLVKAANIKVE